MDGEVKGFLNGEPLEGFDMKIEHNAQPWTPSLARPTFIANSFEVSGTLMVEDAEKYKALLGASNTFTIEQRIDLNPHHRQAAGPWARIKRWRAIVRWHWRKAIRKPLAEVMVVTIPDVPAANLTVV